MSGGHNIGAGATIINKSLVEGSFFNIRYEDDIRGNGKYTVTMVAASSKNIIFFLYCISVNVIWQIITMVLISKQREKLVLNLYKECKNIREIAEAKMSFRDIGYILSEAGKQERKTQMQ